MLVRFKQNWFAPDMQLRTRTEDFEPAVEVPDEWRKLLPRTVRIVEDVAPVADRPADPALADLDLDRAGAKELDRLTGSRKPPRAS
jgi:hypothetical protein